MRIEIKQHKVKEVYTISHGEFEILVLLLFTYDVVEMVVVPLVFKPPQHQYAK